MIPKAGHRFRTRSCFKKEHHDAQAAAPGPDRLEPRRAGARGGAGAERAEGLRSCSSIRRPTWSRSMSQPGSRIRLGGLVKPGSVAARRQSRGALRGDRRQPRHRRSTIRASCRICSAKGRASSPKARSSPAAASRPTSVLAKHDENYMPKEVVDALKKQGRWKERRREDRNDRRNRPLRAGARAGAWRSSSRWCRCWARARATTTLMGVAGPTALAQFALVALAFAALTACYVTLGFLGRQRRSRIRTRRCR